MMVAAICLFFPKVALAQPSTEGAPVLQFEKGLVAPLGAGDELVLQVYGQPDMSGSVLVAEDGTIPVPLVGPVAVAGMTPTDAAEAVEKSLKDGQILVHPVVMLSVVKSRRYRVSVLGEVALPGRYPIDTRTTVLELLAEAGGIKDSGADTIYILRTREDGTSERIAISVSESLSNRTNIEDTVLIAGDVINVPRAEQFSVQGAVRSPGAYRLDPDTSVLEAIAKAGGPNERGSTRRMSIQRKGSDGKYAVRSAKPADPVQAGDVITVKERIF